MGLVNTVAALYVEKNGVYFDLEGVDPWDAERDARNYAGPHPVIAHPPCKRWGRYWSGGPSAKTRCIKGDDGGCFAHALWAVRTFGGVIEHPEASHAWAWFGLRPPPRGGWGPADDYGGATCQVEQGHYGHRARKKTWLLAYGCDLPDLVWGPSKGERLDEGFHSKEERALARARGQMPRPRLNTQERLATPVEFRNVLLDLVRTHPAARRRALESASRPNVKKCIIDLGGDQYRGDLRARSSTRCSFVNFMRRIGRAPPCILEAGHAGPHKVEEAFAAQDPDWIMDAIGATAFRDYYPNLWADRGYGRTS